jgi:hypothetical protein
MYAYVFVYSSHFPQAGNISKLLMYTIMQICVRMHLCVNRQFQLEFTSQKIDMYLTPQMR